MRFRWDGQGGHQATATLATRGRGLHTCPRLAVGGSAHLGPAPLGPPGRAHPRDGQGERVPPPGPERPSCWSRCGRRGSRHRSGLASRPRRAPGKMRERVRRRPRGTAAPAARPVASPSLCGPASLVFLRDGAKMQPQHPRMNRAGSRAPKCAPAVCERPRFNQKEKQKGNAMVYYVSPKAPETPYKEREKPQKPA